MYPNDANVCEMCRFLRPSANANCAHLFGMQPVRGHITLVDVEDAYEIARTIPDVKHREAMYAYFGMDMKRVEAIYPKIQRLETSWHDSVEKKWVIEVAGKWRITIDNIPPSV